MKIAAFLIALVSAVPRPEEGTVNEIVGGNELPVGTQNKYPWMASIQYEFNHFCGGILVNRNTVITAAHCKIPEPIEKLFVSARRYNLNADPRQENSLRFRVVNIIQHPNYSFDAKYNPFDVAIWKVELIEGNSNLIPQNVINFDDGTFANDVNTPLNIMGWGLTQEGGNLSPILRIASVNVIDNNLCKTSFPGLHFTSFCAGRWTGGVDTCQSDSGGPIFYEGNGRTVLVGLSSYGSGCGRPRFPGIYTKISTVMDFIRPRL
jgi:trypsin